MKKFLILTAIFALAFAGCDDPDDGDGNNKTTLQIINQSSKNVSNILWNSILFKEKIDDDSIFNGSWSSNTGNIYLSIFNNNTFSFIHSEQIAYFRTGEWTRNGSTLTIKTGHSRDSKATLISEDQIFLDYLIGDSSITISGIVYLNRIREPLKSGTSIKNTVNSGYSYIFFTFDTIAYRTIELVAVEINEDKTYVFTDYTVVVEVTNPSEPKTLGSL